MRKKANATADPDMLDEYDFTGGVRGKYAERFKQGTNLVLLDPDVAEVFSDSALVNETLRAVLRIARLAAPSGKQQQAPPTLPRGKVTEDARLPESL